MMATSRFLVALSCVMLAACGRQEVSFKRDVMPILEKACIECHTAGGKGYIEAGLRMDSYQDLMKGTKFGPVVVPGNGLVSVIDQVVEGRVDKSIRMPHGGKKIPADEARILRAWVDQGAKNN